MICYGNTLLFLFPAIDGREIIFDSLSDMMKETQTCGWNDVSELGHITHKDHVLESELGESIGVRIIHQNQDDMRESNSRILKSQNLERY